MIRPDLVNDITEGGIDCGLGLCLQCLGEYKLDMMETNGVSYKRVAYAIVMAPIPGTPSAAGSCYQHLNVQKAPSMLDPRRTLRLPNAS
jgi:hypothetical protein